MTANPFALHDHLELLSSKWAEQRAYQQDFYEDKQAVYIQSRQAAILQLLGLANRPDVSVVAELVKVYHQPTYWEEHIVLEAGEKVKMPLVILVPKSTPPYKPILVFHRINGLKTTAKRIILTASSQLSDAALPALLDDFDARQLLHVTFGSALDEYGAALEADLLDGEEAYEAVLAAHFNRHLRPFC